MKDTRDMSRRRLLTWSAGVSASATVELTVSQAPAQTKQVPRLCGAAVDAPVQIATTLRCLMYHDSYRDPGKARRVFARLPPEAKSLDGIDFSSANRACPHGVDVALQMKRARKLLA